MTALPEFALERYFAAREFEAPHLLCASDSESLAMADLLALADDEGRALWEGLRLGYTESAGHPLLRAEIAALYEEVDADGVTVLSGAEEGVYALAAGLLGPGDHAIVPWPAYQSLHEVARGTGAEVTLLPLDPAEGWALDPGAVRRALRPGTRLVVVNSPHNPTGAHPRARHSRRSRGSPPTPGRCSSPTRCTGSWSTTPPIGSRTRRTSRRLL